jgi:bifunctional non-homologous end joining protein LigD
MLWRSPSPTRHPPGFIEPCLPKPADLVPSGPQWAYEIKHDGFRFICRSEGNRIHVFSRRGYDWTDRVPRIVDTFARLPATSVTLDGEGVACDPNGVTNFELPWSDRRWKLARLLRGAGHGVQLSDHMESTDGNSIFRHACAMGLEGIVAKRRDRPYRSGRSPDWIKVKNPNAPAVTRLIEG